jgi:hypothetical protein
MGELFAELVEQLLVQQLVLQRFEHAGFNLVAADGQAVVTSALVAGAEA